MKLLFDRKWERLDVSLVFPSPSSTTTTTRELNKKVYNNPMRRDATGSHGCYFSLNITKLNRMPKKIRKTIKLLSSLRLILGKISSSYCAFLLRSCSLSCVIIRYLQWEKNQLFILSNVDLLWMFHYFFVAIYVFSNVLLHSNICTRENFRDEASQKEFNWTVNYGVKLNLIDFLNTSRSIEIRFLFKFSIFFAN